jgi:hypothetical protein
VQTGDIEPSIMKCIEDVNNSYNRALSTIAKTPIEFKKYEDGILGQATFARRNNDSNSLVLF